MGVLRSLLKGIALQWKLFYWFVLLILPFAIIITLLDDIVMKAPVTFALFIAVNIYSVKYWAEKMD